MKYQIKSNTGEVLLSNLSSEELELVERCNCISQQVECPISGTYKREGKTVYNDTEIYLSTYDPKITGKVFKRYQEVFSFFCDFIVDSCSEFKQSELERTRRLKHNLVTFNTHILQELYELIPQDNIISNNGREQLDFINGAIKQDTHKAAATFLRILKNANFEKSEFDVLDRLYRKEPKVSYMEHPIHKIFMLALNSFWLDFLEKDILVSIQRTNKRIDIDYNSFTVALNHIFDNAVKYGMRGSEITIGFNENVLDGRFDINIQMFSQRVNPKNRQKIFQEGIRGKINDQTSSEGTGVGLYIAKKMLEMNNGSIEFFPNVSPRFSKTIDDIPYEKNNIWISIKDENQLR